jgi:hypothetical protein
MPLLSIRGWSVSDMYVPLKLYRSLISVYLRCKCYCFRESYVCKNYHEIIEVYSSVTLAKKTAGLENFYVIFLFQFPNGLEIGLTSQQWNGQPPERTFALLQMEFHLPSAREFRSTSCVSII